jgi:hypothetical protein
VEIFDFFNEILDDVFSPNLFLVEVTLAVCIDPVAPISEAIYDHQPDGGGGFFRERSIHV